LIYICFSNYIWCVFVLVIWFVVSLKISGARTRPWWRAIRLSGQERPSDTEGGQTVLQTNHFSFGLLPQSLHLVSFTLSIWEFLHWLQMVPMRLQYSFERLQSFAASLSMISPYVIKHNLTEITADFSSLSLTWFLIHFDKYVSYYKNINEIILPNYQMIIFS